MRKYIGLLILILLLVPIRVSAAGNMILISGTENNQDSNTIPRTIDSINEELFIKEIISASEIGVFYDKQEDNVVLEINQDVYSKLSQNEKEEFMGICLQKVQDSNISAINKNKVYNFFLNNDSSVAGLVYKMSEDVRVDIPGAKTLMKPMENPMSIILALVTVIIFVSLGLSMVLDIGYITIPALQLMIQSKKDPINIRPDLISLEAWDAVKVAEISKRTALSIYFKNKTGQLLVLGVCVLYLVSGNLYSLVAYLVDHLQGVTNLLLK